jgi:hypothetical protein
MKAMATDEELHKYVRGLPEIYQEILAAFPRIEPTRMAGYGLALQSLASDFEDRGLAFTMGHVAQAAKQLQQHGIVDLKHGMFVHPTEFGERLITSITGEHAPVVTVPVLPPPPI